MPSEYAREPSCRYIRLLGSMSITTYSTIATAVETRQFSILYADASTTKKNAAHFSAGTS